MDEKRLRRCCFTGHRPEKLNRPEKEIRNALELAIREAISQGYITFITGMARGTDIIAGEIVLSLKEEFPQLHLICALPHPSFEKRWSFEWQTRFRNVIADADYVKEVCPSFSMSSYQKRNEFMVLHSARIIAVYNGSPGGTRNTIDFAQKQGIDVVLIEG